MNNESKSPYGKIIKQFLILLGLMFLSPVLFNIALKANKVYKDNTYHYITYILIILSTGLLIFTVIFGFKVFKNLMSIIFEDE